MPHKPESLARKLRDMHALAADSCDPEFNHALLDAAHRIERLESAVVGINIALARDENLDAGARLAIDVRKELQF